MRKVWKLAGKGLTFMLKNLKKDIRHFTLHRLDEMNKHIEKGVKRLKKAYGENTRLITRQYDVKRMFTDLNREEIGKAINWLFKEMEKGGRRETRGMERRSQRSHVTVDKETGEARWGKGGSDETRFRGKIYMMW